LSHQIQIDDDVFAAIKAQAIPFQDHEPNDVLRRLLFAGDEAQPTETPGPVRTSEGTADQRTSKASKRSKPAKRRRAPSSALLPETEYRYPILRALFDSGGRMPTSEVVTAVGEHVKDKLLSADLEILGKKPRWEGRVQFTRLQLVRDGLMKEDSPRGVWEITSVGEETVEKQLQADAVAAGPIKKRAMAGKR
jgi:hypothetical protein